MRELDLIVQELLVGHSLPGHPALDPEFRSDLARPDTEVPEHPRPRVVSYPVSAALLDAVAGLAGEMDHGDGFERRAPKAHPGARVPDDAGLAEARRIEPELARVDETDGDLDEVGPDVLVDVVLGPDVALRVRQARASEQVGVVGPHHHVIVRIPERVSVLISTACHQNHHWYILAGAAGEGGT